MEASSSVEFVDQVGEDAGLRGRQQQRRGNGSSWCQIQNHCLVRSNSHQYLDQEASATDVLSQEDDFLDRLEDEEALDDMTPDGINPHAHRRTSSPGDCPVNKKSNKPMMEKKRRQRINRCLSELKTLVLEAMKKDPSRYSKLEKADILEMTVRHLQFLHRQESVTRNGRVHGGEDGSKYRAGFVQCAAEVTKYLATMSDVPQDLHTKVLSHLNCIATNVTTNVNNNATCVQNSVNVAPNPAPIILVVNNPTAPAPVSHIATQQFSFQESAGNSMGAQPNFAVITAPRAQNISAPVQHQLQPNGLQIVPTRLNNGDLALVLPATTTLPLTTQHREVRPAPSASLQASAPVLTAILTSDRNQTSSSSIPSFVQPPALSTSSEDSALGAETLDVSDSDTSGICTPMSSMSSASSPLPAEEAGGVSPKRASTSRSVSPPKHQFLNSSCFREELTPTACSSQYTPRRHQMIAPKPAYPWTPPRASTSDGHKRKKANTPPPPPDDEEGKSVWRPW